jgi:hypothetical protein
VNTKKIMFLPTTLFRLLFTLNSLNKNSLLFRGGEHQALKARSGKKFCKHLGRLDYLTRARAFPSRLGESRPIEIFCARARDRARTFSRMRLSA